MAVLPGFSSITQPAVTGDAAILRGSVRPKSIIITCVGPISQQDFIYTTLFVVLSTQAVTQTLTRVLCNEWQVKATANTQIHTLTTIYTCFQTVQAETFWLQTLCTLVLKRCNTQARPVVGAVVFWWLLVLGIWQWTSESAARSQNVVDRSLHSGATYHSILFSFTKKPQSQQVTSLKRLEWVTKNGESSVLTSTVYVFKETLVPPCEANK